MSEINDLARQSFNTAIIRGKTNKDLSHNDIFFGILEELREFRVASDSGSPSTSLNIPKPRKS